MRRPLCVVLVALITCIIIFYKPDKSFDKSIDQKNITLYACVDEILGTSEINAIIVKDVVREHDSDRSEMYFNKNIPSEDSIESAAKEGAFFCEKLKVYPGKSFSGDSLTMSDIGVGNILRLTGNVVSPERPGNPGQFDEQVYFRSQGLDASLFLQKYEVIDDKEDGIAMLLYRVRCFLAGAFAAVVPEREAGILSAMLLGEKSGLDDEVRELYTETGIAHILAISGLHISMIGMGLFAFLRRFVMPMRWAVIVTGIMLFLYGMLSGFSIATRRAVIMTMLVLIARLIGERYDRINALALAAIVELLIHPASLFLPGFLLSYGTVAGIALFVDELKGIMSGDDRSIRYKLFTVVSGSVGVTVVTLPIMVQCYHEIPVFSVIVNIILLPLMTYILATAVLGGVIAYISSFISGFILGTSYYILRLYQLVCDIVTAIPLHRMVVGHRSVVSVVIYYAVLFLIVLILKRVKKYKKGEQRTGKNTSEKRTKLCLVSAAMIVINIVIFILPITSGDAVFPSFSRDGISITNLDIGQGDCSHILLADGTVIMVDGGSSDIKNIAKYRIVPYLKYMGEDTIDYMIMTHSDADHIDGFEEIIKKDDHFGLQIKNVVLPKIKEPDDNYIQFEHIIKEYGKDINILYMEAGDELHLSDAVLTCLHPSRGYDWEDANDYSTVIELDYGGFKGLFTGDLGFHGEEKLLGNKSYLKDVDYLKVGHHGSAYSSSEAFLSVIRPEISVASAGHNNRYHHPSPEAVARIREAGSVFYSTIDCGAVTVFTDGTNISVDKYISEEGYHVPDRQGITTE